MTDDLVEEVLVAPLLEKFHELSHELTKEFSIRIIDCQEQPRAECLRANMATISKREKVTKRPKPEGEENNT
jgi:hypothetical protein